MTKCFIATSAFIYEAGKLGQEEDVGRNRTEIANKHFKPLNCWKLTSGGSKIVKYYTR
jgi:hypothetical protein